MQNGARLIVAPPLLLAALIAAIRAFVLQGTVLPVWAWAAGAAARSPPSRIAAPPPKAAFTTERVFIA